jgi:hypothetical protein
MRRLLATALLVGASMTLIGLSSSAVLAAFGSGTMARQSISVGRLHIDIDRADGLPAPDQRAIKWAPVDLTGEPPDATGISLSHTLDVRNEGTLRVGKMWLAVQTQPALPSAVLTQLTLSVTVTGPTGSQTETGSLLSWLTARTDSALAEIKPGQTVHLDLSLSGTLPPALRGTGPIELRYLITATE